jgi:hypothetical protein
VTPDTGYRLTATRNSFRKSIPLYKLTGFLDGMNSLQHIPGENEYGPVLATFNPPPEVEIDEPKLQGRWKYEYLDDQVHKLIRYVSFG